MSVMRFGTFHLIGSPNMAPAAERFGETLDQIALADDFTFDGKYASVPTPVTVLPRPLQQPHPPIWIAVQSETSLDWAADHGCDIILSGASTAWGQLPAWIERFKQRRQPAPDDPGRP